MNRKEEILNAGQQYLDSMDEFQRYHTYPREAFIDGAKWSDEHSKSEMVSLDKACKVISEMVQKFCPNLIRCGEDLKYWEDEFRKKLKE